MAPQQLKEPLNDRLALISIPTYAASVSIKRADVLIVDRGKAKRNAVMQQSHKRFIGITQRKVAGGWAAKGKYRAQTFNTPSAQCPDQPASSALDIRQVRTRLGSLAYLPEVSGFSTEEDIPL